MVGRTWAIFMPGAYSERHGQDRDHRRGQRLRQPAVHRHPGAHEPRRLHHRAVRHPRGAARSGARLRAARDRRARTARHRGGRYRPRGAAAGRRLRGDGGLHRRPGVLGRALPLGGGDPAYPTGSCRPWPTPSAWAGCSASCARRPRTCSSRATWNACAPTPSCSTTPTPCACSPGCTRSVPRSGTWACATACRAPPGSWPARWGWTTTG